MYASLGRYDEAISEEEKARIVDVADPETGCALPILSAEQGGIGRKSWN